MQAKPDPSFLANALKLITATSFAQIVGIIIMPLLTRIYTPEMFGLLQIYLSIVFIIVPLSTFNYEVAILIPENEDDAQSVLWGSLLITGIVTLLCYPIIYSFNKPIIRLFNADKLGVFIYLVPISVFCMGTFSALSFWLIRKNRFGLIATCNSWQAIVNQGTKLLLGYATAGAFWGLLSGNIISDFIVLVIIIIRCSRNALSSFWKALSLSRIKHNLLEFYRFPFYSLPSKFVYEGSAELPVFMLAYYFSPAILGYYALGRRLMWMPLNIVSNAISRVLLQQVSSKQKDLHALMHSTKRVLERLALISVYSLTLLGVTGPDIFSIIFGRNWHQAGIFTSLLCIWGIANFIFTPFFELTSILQKQHVYLFYNIISFVTKFVMLVLGGYFANPLLAIGILSLSNAILTMCFGIVVLKYFNLHYATIMHILLKNIKSTLISIMPVLLVKIAGLPQIALYLSIVASLLIYVIIIKKTEQALYMEFRQYVFSRLLS